jgi:rhamnosyltransferase
MVKLKKKISVIIRVKNEEQWVGHCIQSVLDFIDKPEIIIVDDNSTDKSIKISSLFIEDPNLEKKNKNYTKIKFVKINNYTPGKAINLGVKNSSNQYILVISAHCILKKMNTDKLIDYLHQNIAVFGNQIPILNGKKIKRRYIWSHFADKNVINMFSKFENRYFFHNALSFFKKETLIKYPFDENLYGKEDRYWAASMINNHKKNIIYSTDFEAEHNYTINGSTWKNF